jgi:hypothetical protein
MIAIVRKPARGVLARPPLVLARACAVAIAALGCGRRTAPVTSAPDAGAPSADVSMIDAPAERDARRDDGADVLRSDAAACRGAGAVPPWAKVVRLTVAEHGIDAWVDAFEINVGKPEMRDRLVVRLRADGAPPQHVAFVGLEALPDPLLLTARSGDAEHASIVVHYDDHGATWNRIHDDVLDIRDGKLIRAEATHVRTAAKALVGVSTLLSGASNDGSKIHATRDCGLELLMVLCDSRWPAIKKRPATVQSKNLVFFVRGGRWYWDESDGMECVPFGSGHSKAAYPFPDRDKFPPSAQPAE